MQQGKPHHLSDSKIARLNTINFEWAVRSQRPPKRKNKRGQTSGSTSATSCAIDASTTARRNRSDNTQPSEFHFNVEIPDFYNDLTYSGGGGCAEEDAGSTNSDDSDAKEDTTMKGDEVANVSTAEQRIETHSKFIFALEKYGGAAGSEQGTLSWHAMAAHLKWTIEDVKVYAYSYFKALSEGTMQQIQATNSSAEKGSAWSTDEKLLLDSLMLKHCTDASTVDKKLNGGAKLSEDQHASNWERVAASLSGRTAKECQEMGMLRLGARS
jgi:hypothetical protein